MSVAAAAFNKSKQELLENCLWPGKDASEEERRKYKGPSQLRFLLSDVIQHATEHAVQQGASEHEIENYANDGIEIVLGLQGSVTDGDAGVDTLLNFWRHDDNPVQLVKQHGPPYMDKNSIQGLASNYLNLPYRVPRLERLLVDMLIALEYYAYADLMLHKPFARWLLPAISPLKRPHALASYFMGLFWDVLILGGIAFAAQAFPIFGQTAADWTTSFALFLLAAVILISTMALPFAWRAQRKERNEVRTLLMLMHETYAELAFGQAAVSTRRVRDLASKAADAGVVWPNPLFAVLDDNISRIGRL